VTVLRVSPITASLVPLSCCCFCFAVANAVAVSAAHTVFAYVIAACFTAETSIASPVGDKLDPHTHTVHDEVVADTVADNAVDNAEDNAMDEMMTHVSSPADPIVPLLSFEQQSTDSAATAIAGKQQPQRYPSPL